MTTHNAPLLHGVISALVTPCTVDGNPDIATLRKVVDHNIEQGVHGLIVGAGTGEAASLSDAQRRELAEVVVSHVGGRIPVVVGTGAVATEHAVSLSVHAASIGASAVMPVPPFYDPVTLDATYAYYQAIDAAIDIPIMAYNHPSATGTPLPADFLGRLGRELTNVEYLKDSSGDMGQIARLATYHADDIKLLCGDELLYLPALELGAYGCVAGVANFMGAPLVRVYEAYARGEYVTALEEWQRALPALLAVIDAGPWHASVKAACEITGLAVGEPRSPIQPLDRDARDQLAEALRAAFAGELSLA